jgi:hypothetical protein
MFLLAAEIQISKSLHRCVLHIISSLLLHWGRRDLRDRESILRHNARYCAGVGRGNEGASSNRAEHAALLLCLRKTHRTQDLLYLTDSESLLKTISKWVGEGTRANLATTPDEDIVREIVQILQERVTAGANTFLYRHRATSTSPHPPI